MQKKNDGKELFIIMMNCSACPFSVIKLIIRILLRPVCKKTLRSQKKSFNAFLVPYPNQISTPRNATKNVQ